MKHRRVWKLAEVGVAVLLALQPLGMIAASAFGEGQSTPAIATTTIQDTVYRADGTAAGGTVLISWPAFSTSAGDSVQAGSTAVTIGAGGALTVSLVANSGSTPMGSYYTVIYHLDDGSLNREYWVVPVTTFPVQVSAIRSTVLPASVAMQTVSKSYVDTAIAVAVAGHPLDSSPYVLKAGDTMTGPLNLPGDPTAPLQASDKNYVDEQVAGLNGGQGQKVSLLPQASQVVAQPPGTELAVNSLNGAFYASQFVSGAGANGIANADASSACVSGCHVVAEQTYTSAEHFSPQNLNSQTHIEDERGGGHKDTFFNPLNTQYGGQNFGDDVDVASTQTAQSVLAATGAGVIFSTSLQLSNEALAGGSNAFPEHVQGSLPYFKTTYSALSVQGTSNTPGQHDLVPQSQTCFSVGDCLMGSQFLVSSGGVRDDADEGTHPYDIQIAEDTRVFEGTCSSGCTPGSTLLQVTATAGGGTQGDGRYLIDKNPAGLLTAGAVTGGSATGGRQPTVSFSGTSFAVSTLLETAQTITTQANSILPGTVTVPIVTSGVPAGFATSTAALPASSGVACVSDVAVGDGRSLNFEMAAYTVVDTSHLQMTLNRAHATGATVAAGGLCGYGLEQTVDTSAGIRQVVPVLASTSPNSVLYMGSVGGVQGQTSAYTNVNLVIASIARTNNVVTVTIAGNLPVDVNGLTLTAQGVADSSYNGSFVVTTTSANTLTYASSGANSTSTGGSLSLITGGFVLYPMAEVLQVYNPTTHAIDGQMMLAANTVSWAAGDPIEQPHYFVEDVHPDIQYITQYQPRPTGGTIAGIYYQGNDGPGLIGWQINNTTPASSYFGNGGTHTAPSIGIALSGVWNHSIEMQAGENAAFQIHCNSHGCGAWDSAYDLFQLDTGVGEDRLTYSPATSFLNYSLRGTTYQFSPAGFTAGTINVGTLNASSVQGAFTGSFAGTVTAASVPVFIGSGSGHMTGAVPDPGPTAGTTRFLREDGLWVVTGGGGSAATASTLGTVQLAAGQTSAVLGSAASQPSSAFAASTGTGVIGAARGSAFAALDTVYDFTNQTGATVTDRIGSSNATLAGSTPPAWTGSGLAFGQTSSVSLPAALNTEKTFYFAVSINPITASAQTANVYPTILSSSTGGSGFNIILEQPASISTGLSDYTYSPTLYPNSLSTATTNTLSGFSVLTVVCGTGSGNLDHLYINAVEVSYTTQASNCGQQTSGNLFLGPSGVSPWTGGFFPGTFYGFGAGATQHTLAQIQQNVSAFFALMNTKGVATTPVPVNLATPQLFAIGDSITAGTNGQTPYTSQLTLTNQPAYSITNYGIIGIRLASILSHEANRAAPRCATQGGPAVAILEGGTNDVAAPGNPLAPQIVWNSAAAWASLMRRSGCLPFMVTMNSRTGSGYGGSTMDALKDTYDALIVQQAKAVGFAGVLDIAANPLLGADNANANTTYFQAVDHIHPTTLGNGLMAAAISNGLNWYFGYNESNPHVLNSLSGFTMACSDGSIDLAGLSAGGNIALPDCTGASGATFRINNPQSAYAVTVTADSASHPVNGSTTAVPVPANGTLTLRLVPNPKTTAGWHWEF